MAFPDDPCPTCPRANVADGCQAQAQNNPKLCDRANPDHPDFLAPYRAMLANTPGTPAGLAEATRQLGATWELPIDPTLLDAVALPDAIERGIADPVGRARDRPADRVVIRSTLCSWTGYGQIAEWLGRGLERRGVPVRYWPTRIEEGYRNLVPWVRERVLPCEPDDPWILSLHTPLQVGMVPGHRVVAFTMWEVTGFPAPCLASLNACEAVLTPCSWNASCLSAAGVKGPLFVVPMGVDPSEGYVPQSFPPARPFRIGTAGRVSHGGERKGMREAMLAFQAAFPDDPDVQLELKIWPDCKLDIRGVRSDDRILINRAPMAPAAMAGWFGSLHCYLTLSKGEGWGLQTLQSLACGRPVVAPFFSGTADFVDARCGWPVAYDLVPAGEEFYRGLGHWAQPRVDDAAERLRNAEYEWRWNRDFERFREMSDAAANVGRRFTWDHTAAELVRALQTVGMLGGDA